MNSGNKNKVLFKMDNSEILCCIYNHNHNENSDLWLSRLVKSGYDAYILDSGSDVVLDNNRVIKFDNIYWGGLFNETLKLWRKKKSKYIFVVCDDILIDDENFLKLDNTFKVLKNQKRIGMYQPSTTTDSHNVWPNNFNKMSNSIRLTRNIEGFCFLVSDEVLKVMNELSLKFNKDNRSGWGIDILLSYHSLRLGLLNVVDDNVVIKHPLGKPSYNANDANTEMKECFKKLGTSYNELIELSEQFYKKTIEKLDTNKNKIVCCLLNYKHDKNAIRLYNLLAPHYTTYIIDTFHKENNTKMDFSENILYLNNVYWGGSIIAAYEIMKKNDGKYLLTIDTDVEIDDENAKKMIESLKIFNVTNDIGVYTATLKLGSKALGLTQPTLQNAHLYNQNTKQLRNVHRIEGWFNVIKKDILDDIIPYVKLPDNKYGWGFGHVFCRRAILRNLRIVADDRFEVFHPAGLNYNNMEAQKEEESFKKRYFELSCVLPEEMNMFVNEIKY